LAYYRRYRQEHREQEIARGIQWQKDNPDRARASARRWYKANPEKAAARDARRRACQRGAIIVLTLEQEAFKRKVGEAIYPGEELDLHHIVPLSRGGGHSWGNIVFISASLNRSISDKLPEEVYRQLDLTS